VGEIRVGEFQDEDHGVWAGGDQGVVKRKRKGWLAGRIWRCGVRFRFVSIQLDDDRDILDIHMQGGRR